MIIHIFNSSLISGPETLVIPALAKLKTPVKFILLHEMRLPIERFQAVEKYFKEMGVSWEVVEVRSRFDRKGIRNLAKLLASFPCSVAHAHDVKPSFYLWRAAALIPGRSFPIVTTHHGVSGRTGAISRLYEYFYSTSVATRFDRILCVSTEDRGRLLQRGVPENKIRVHLNGVTRPLISESDRASVQMEIRKRWGMQVAPGEILLGVVARLAGEKRHLFLLEMLRIIREAHPTLKFRVICFGSGPLEKDLKAATKKMGLEDKVIWFGYRAGVGEEIAGLDLLLSLSRAEGLPINLIEAGWAGTAIFSTLVGGVADLVPKAEFGVTVPLAASTQLAAEKLASCIKSPLVLRQSALAFQGHVAEHFSSEVWLKRLAEIYDELHVS